MTKLKPFSVKVRRNVQNFFNQNLVIGSFLENGFEATLTSKTSVVSAWKEHILLFFLANFSLKKLKPFVGKERQNIQSYLNQSLAIGSFLENSFEAILSSKTSVLIVWKEHCSVFCKFLSDKVERISWESEANVQHYLNQNLFLGASQKMVLKVPWAETRMYGACEKSIFNFFANFWVTKLKPFLENVRQSIQRNLNQHLVIGSFWENDFGDTSRSKTSVASIWKEDFSVFWKFLIDKVETIFRKSEVKRSRLFKSKFRYRNVLRKWSWGYLELKNEFCEHLKRAFFSFLQIFEWRSGGHFLGN